MLPESPIRRYGPSYLKAGGELADCTGFTDSPLSPPSYLKAGGELADCTESTASPLWPPSYLKGAGERATRGVLGFER